MSSAISSIIIIAISVLVGYVSFLVISDLSYEQKKKNLEEITNQLVNFIIFIWISKIVLNVPTFIKDPFVILAYPSNSNAFYLAILLSTLMLAYKVKKKQMNVLHLVESAIPILLVTSFSYEFIQVIWKNITYSIDYMAILVVLIALYLIVRDRLSTHTMINIMLCGWTIGVGILSIVKPFTTMFGYIMAPWFIGLFFIISFILVNIDRKRVSQ